MKASIGFIWVMNWCAQVSFIDKFKTILESNEYIYPSINGDLYMNTLTIGIPSKTSKYARTELRECNNGKKVFWDSDNGTKVLSVVLSIETLPKIIQSTMFIQVKLKGDGAGLMAFLRKSLVYIRYRIGNQTERITVDTNYKLGTKFRFTVVVSNNTVKFYYYKRGYSYNNGYKLKFKDAYFKVGNYIQSPPENETNYTTRVIIYDIEKSVAQTHN
jgi:hypothetical protein